MTPKRLLPVLILAAAAGCKKDPPPATPPTSAAATSAAVKPTPAPAGDPAKAAAFAAKFLDAVQAGTASAAQLTPEFKKIIAEPTFTADLERGYSDDRADAWLKALKGKCPPDVGPGGTISGGSSTAGLAYRHSGGRVAILKLVPAGGDWAVNLFAVGPMVAPKATTDNAAELTAVAFLAAMLQPDDRLAEGLLTPAFKAKLAPPFGSDKRGYNRGLLESKLAGFRGTATTFRGVTLSGPTATAELVTPKGPVKVSLTLTADGSRVDSVTLD